MTDEQYYHHFPIAMCIIINNVDNRNLLLERRWRWRRRRDNKDDKMLIKSEKKFNKTYYQHSSRSLSTRWYFNQNIEKGRTERRTSLFVVCHVNILPFLGKKHSRLQWYKKEIKTKRTWTESWIPRNTLSQVGWVC